MIASSKKICSNNKRGTTIIKTIENEIFDSERALYALKDARVRSCTFAGPADGESALKEAENIEISDCRFALRYPLWHVKGFLMCDSEMNSMTRAALWYAADGKISRCIIGGIKALRECRDIAVNDCRINSDEFGWKCENISIKSSEIAAEYLLLDSKNIRVENVEFKGKYSFQYTENLTVTDSVLDTKDAFWHSKNATVTNCTVKGEYLGWYSQGLTLINCRITGTQPLCYCRDLKLINCTMADCDLAFEYSDVNADISGSIVSVKNPKSGIITADGFGEIIREDAVTECTGKTELRRK